MIHKFYHMHSLASYNVMYKCMWTSMFIPLIFSGIGMILRIIDDECSESNININVGSLQAELT